ncbi:MAG: TetR/AcrR family transcriptional regulator [Candidatus Dormibacteraeota bacterium]|nr:TetR/AcrR family transcriptional regulator [Candidatus Dormibacteraeota bacterium]
MSRSMQRREETKRRNLTRQAIVERSLEIGRAEGLEAVSLRRLATELGVTPMALYRHVKDKADLLNAMLEADSAGLDILAGVRSDMHWTEQLRLVMMNFRREMNARPLYLALAFAYSGDITPAVWKPNEDILTILLGAGFSRRDAPVMLRIVSNLVAGYLTLLRQSGPDIPELDERQLELARKRVELNGLSLPPDEFPSSVASARELAEAWLSDPDMWWNETVDLLIFGTERMLERRRDGAGGRD